MRNDLTADRKLLQKFFFTLLLTFEFNKQKD